MNMAHPAIVRTLMEEIEAGRLEGAALEYWTDWVNDTRYKVHISLDTYDTEHRDRQEGSSA